MCIIIERIKKCIHYTISFKSLLLLFLTMYCDMEDLLENLTMRDAEKRVNPDIHIQNYPDPDTCDFKGTQMILCTGDLGYRSPFYWMLFGLTVFSACYGVCVFMYSLCSAPKYGSIKYYAHSVMTRRQKYFRCFMRSLYVTIIAQFFIYVGLVIFWDLRIKSIDESELDHWQEIPWRFVRNLVATILVCEFAVGALDSTNEININYNPKYQKTSNPIMLSPPSIFVNDQDVFEILEEAVMIYALNGNDHFLKKILKHPTQNNIERVTEYYNTVSNEALGRSKSYRKAMKAGRSTNQKLTDV